MGAFIAPILAALRWMGLTAFTGLGGVSLGTAVAAGFMVFVARLGISLITFGIIYTTTSAMMSFALTQFGASAYINMLEASGMTTGINIILSTLMSIISIRITKVGLKFAQVGGA